MRTLAAFLLMTAIGSVCSAAEPFQPPPIVVQPIDPATGLPVGIPQTRGVASTTVNLPAADDIKNREPDKRFDLDFKGGFPKNLVEEVEKASKMPVNAIIPEEHKDFFLPPLKLRNVTAPQLFDALTKASAKPERYNIGPPNAFQYQQFTKSYGFRTSDPRPSANSIWYFFVDVPPTPPAQAPPPPPKPVCRFWQLEPYLDKMQVEDITTAIETGWKMLGVSPAPKLSFHKDTKLLIVVGQQDQLALVDDVLRELTPRLDPATGLPMTKGPRNKPIPPATGEKPSKQ